MTRRKLFMLTIALVWVLLIGGTFVVDQLRIDSCLDRGGSFDYEKFTCDLTTSHNATEYFRARLPRFIGLTVTVLVFGLAWVWAEYRRSGLRRSRE